MVEVTSKNLLFNTSVWFLRMWSWSHAIHLRWQLPQCTFNTWSLLPKLLNARSDCILTFVPTEGSSLMHSQLPVISLAECHYQTDPCLTLPAGRMPARCSHPALRPQYGPSAHPRQTSRSIEPLWSFGKHQKEKPVISAKIHFKCVSQPEIATNSLKTYSFGV